MTDASTDRLTVYADYVCPFCYLGREALRQYRATREEPLAVEWHPFDLRSDRRRPDGTLRPPADGHKDDDYFDAVRQQVRRLRERFGVEMAIDVARDVDSRNAQLASVFVRMEHPDDWLAFDRAVYAALWQDERAIGDPAVLADVAEAVGLPSGVIETALADDGVERRLEDQFEAARLRGIGGVPTFVYGDHSVRGAVPPAQLRRLVEGS